MSSIHFPLNERLLSNNLIKGKTHNSFSEFMKIFCFECQTIIVNQF